MPNPPLPSDPCPDLLAIHDRERAIMAPYATFSLQSRGRKYREADHPYRGPYQRDRDRVVHSAAFRRLSGKMQVFTGEMGDYHRTRLTHTHEVASISRTIARALRLNEDLVEALALLHDIGHPPYGHAGEEALAACLHNAGGFSHNAFALTLVEELERRYPEFPGLNLTYEVLEGQQARVDKASSQTPRLEVQVVDLADSISYDAADIDDAVKLNLVRIEELAELSLIAELLADIRARHGDLTGSMLRRRLAHALIDRRVTTLLEWVGPELAQQQFRSAEAIQESGFRLQYEERFAESIRQLEQFLYDRVYRHPRLIEVRKSAQHRVRRLFEALCESPQAMPARHRRRIDLVGLERACGEYIAGMTDRYCERKYRELVVRP